MLCHGNEQACPSIAAHLETFVSSMVVRLSLWSKGWALIEMNLITPLRSLALAPASRTSSLVGSALRLRVLFHEVSRKVKDSVARAIGFAWSCWLCFPCAVWFRCNGNMADRLRRFPGGIRGFPYYFRCSMAYNSNSSPFGDLTKVYSFLSLLGSIVEKYNPPQCLFQGFPNLVAGPVDKAIPA